MPASPTVTVINRLPTGPAGWARSVQNPATVDRGEEDGRGMDGSPIVMDAPIVSEFY